MNTDMYPLALFPTVSDDLGSMDSRTSLKHLTTFMKNTLIRGLNRVYELAPLIDASSPEFRPFLEYAQFVCDTTCQQLEGDEIFFTSSTTQGVILLDRLGNACNPSNPELYRRIKNLQQTLNGWAKSQNSYSCTVLRDHLQFGLPLVEVMEKQLDSIKEDRLVEFVTNEELRSMVEEHMEWLVSHSNAAVLLPFIIAHHDPDTSKFWPPLTKEGMAVMPELVKVYKRCWTFAPFNPVTKTIQARPS